MKSAASGVYLRNASVTIEGTALATLTNESGEFLLTGLPEGGHRLVVSYTGMIPETVAVTGTGAPLEIALQDFGQKAPGAGEILKLDAFRVTTSREMSAADMAINEKRIARNIKDVVATDAFGNMARDNLGDFLQFLPGVEVEGDGTAPLTVGLRGMPAEYTNIEMDGAGLSVPQTGGSTRVTALRGLTMSNVDRIEITKGPTPDTGADSIGGRINMIPRSAFDRSRPEFRYRTFLLMNSEFLNLRKTPGGKEGGGRYEDTHVVARGTLTNLQLQFQHDRNGKLVDGNLAVAGVQTVPITTDPLEVAKLTRLPLANLVDTTYGDFYPSVNATLTVRENLLLRLGYAHTIGRPALAQLIPTTSVTEVTSPAENATGSGLGTISTSNPTLQPWTGRNYDGAVEYYTRAGGLFSVSVYRRDVRNFISTTNTIATPAMLEELGLPDDYAGYLLSHPENSTGSVRQTGVELSGRQRLLPWLSVFANYSRNRTTGIRAGDFGNAQTRRANAGLQFAFRALSVSTNYSWTGQRRGATSGLAPNAFVYTRPRELVNLSAEYLVRRNTSVFFTLTNVFKDPLVNETYGTDTPAYARLTSRREDGSQVQLGLKGTF